MTLTRVLLLLFINVIEVGAETACKWSSEWLRVHSSRTAHFPKRISACACWIVSVSLVYLCLVATTRRLSLAANVKAPRRSPPAL